MKSILASLMVASLVVTPVAATSSQITTIKQNSQKNYQSTLKSEQIQIEAWAAIGFKMWSTSKRVYSKMVNLICLDDYATSFSDFLSQFPKMKIWSTAYAGWITQNFVGYTNPIVPSPHIQGNSIYDPIVINTADIFKPGQSVDTIIGSYNYSDTSTTAYSQSHVVTGSTQIAGKTFLTMYCYAYVKGNAGPFRKYDYDVARMAITDVDFLTS